VIRPRTIDRDQLLNCAEDIAASGGISEVTFGAVASAAGVPKASVQSAFGTRESLLDAMLQRWVNRERERFNALAGSNPTPADCVVAHLRSTASESHESMLRMASLVATLGASGTRVDRVVDWYESRGLSTVAESPEQKRLRAAFLAAEGAFFVRYLVGLPMSDEVWQDIFSDLGQLAATTLPSR